MKALRKRWRRGRRVDAEQWQELLGELSGGILRCDECGHTLRPKSAHTKSSGRFHYYSCRSRYNTGPSRDCSTRKFLRAEQIEEQVWRFVRGLLRDPERIRAGIDRLIEEERTDAGRDPRRDAEFWSRKMTEVEVERRGYHRLAAKGHMTDEELVAALSRSWTRFGRPPSANWKRRGPGARRFGAWSMTETP
jgi:hypothetical protein